MITVDAILLGGGQGNRFFSSKTSSAALPKQFHSLNDVPVFVHALKALLSLNCLRQIVIAVVEPFISLTSELVRAHLPPVTNSNIRIINGGIRRQDSARLALEALEVLTAPSRVLVHDACRPFLSPEFLQRIKEKMLDRSYGAWVPVVSVSETLKKVENEQVIHTLDRSTIKRVQTPQIFEFAVVRSLSERAREQGELTFTDDASLCEYYGIPVGIFEGDRRNIKLTYDYELDILRSFILSSSESSRGQSQCVSESDMTSTV